jgi:2,4-dienoyl-CoA reductase-like NADH-dependent reductase (Old Yellow Enzyme family)
MSALFQPFTLKDTTLRNRIVVSPMCQYTSVDGVATDWHPAHYTSLARGGAGLVVLEATAVSPEGRITPYCAGLWTDEQAQALISIVRSIESAGAVAGIQIGHAGSKASTRRPWEGGDYISADDPRGWHPLSASQMTLDDILRVKSAFAAAAVRARDAGFEWLELHFAHGYLATNFFSKHTNQRGDEYGGSFENRSRFLLETVAAVRGVWPANRPLTVRLGAVEFDGQDEENLAESISLSKRFKELGVDLIDISLRLCAKSANIPWSTPALLAPIAERIRREVSIPVMASFRLDAPEVAEQAVASGQLDLVAIAKAMLANPHWPYYAARKLGVDRASGVLPTSYAYWLQRYSGT